MIRLIRKDLITIFPLLAGESKMGSNIGMLGIVGVHIGVKMVILESLGALIILV